jgi:hypothetical protein
VQVRGQVGSYRLSLCCGVQCTLPQTPRAEALRCVSLHHKTCLAVSVNVWQGKVVLGAHSCPVAGAQHHALLHHDLLRSMHA